MALLFPRPIFLPTSSTLIFTTGPFSTNVSHSQHPWITLRFPRFLKRALSADHCRSIWSTDEHQTHAARRRDASWSLCAGGRRWISPGSLYEGHLPDALWPRRRRRETIKNKKHTISLTCSRGGDHTPSPDL
ncbi:hypothetical protein BD779DRAFT_1541255, partial [Infundibulicybe gibba]